MDLQFSPLEKTNHLTTVLGTAWLYFAACRPQMAIYPRLVICAIGQRYLSQFIIIGQGYLSQFITIGQRYLSQFKSLLDKDIYFVNNCLIYF